MADFNFKLNPSDYLGIDNESFKTNMLQLALTKPTQYFELRKAVLENVKRAAVKQQYAIYYWLLTAGTFAMPDGTDSEQSIVDVPEEHGNVLDTTTALFVPNIPKQKVNEFALKAAKTIDAIAEEAIEMILPMDYKKISDDRVMQHTAANLGFDNGKP
jgi:hypothetical protein